MEDVDISAIMIRQTSQSVKTSLSPQEEEEEDLLRKKSKKLKLGK